MSSENPTEWVYLDHNATTPLDPRVRDAMLPWLGPQHGNPSSIHRFGQRARAAVEDARAAVASLIGADPLALVFAASGTEANNAVIRDLCARATRPGRLVVTVLEHPSILETVRHLEGEGFAVNRVGPGPEGVVDAAAMREAIDSQTTLVAMMLANNELGTLQPVAEVAAHCRELGVPLLCDAVQAAGKIAVDVEALGADYLTVAAHKFHGPLGAAALWIREGAPFDGFLWGGSQERRRRAGTENVAALVGFGRCAQLAEQELSDRQQHLLALRQRLERGLLDVEGATIHGHEAPRLPHTTHVAFEGLEGEALLIRLDLAGFAVSTGSACASGVVEPSPALRAMGLSTAEALSSLRISLGVPNTVREVDAFLAATREAVAGLRQLCGTSVR